MVRPTKKPKLKTEATFWTAQKLEVYLKVKSNYSFWVQNAGLLDILVEEMVKRREEERTAAWLVKETEPICMQCLEVSNR